jgi:hypothetical protein
MLISVELEAGTAGSWLLDSDKGGQLETDDPSTEGSTWLL